MRIGEAVAQAEPPGFSFTGGKRVNDRSGLTWRDTVRQVAF
jgi:hypothetical protein